VAVDFSDLGAVPVTAQSGKGIDFSDLGGIPASKSTVSDDFERSSNYPNSKMTDASIPDYLAVEGIVKAPALAWNLGKAGIGLGSRLISKIGAIRGAPQALEDALSGAATKFGTQETPSMVGNTVRNGLESEQAANDALAQKLYGQVPKDVPVSTTSLAKAYGNMRDELPPGLRNAVEKHVQLEQNPIRPNDIGTTNTPNIYSASPGIPSQLPPNQPPVGDLIKLRSKLGAAARSGGIDGYNAGQLKLALDSDISNLGSGEGPLGQMTNEAVNDPLKRATSYYRDMMGQQQTPLYRKLATSKIEDIPDIIFKNGRTQDVLEARAAIGEDGFQAAKKSFFNDVINSKDVGKTLGKYGQNNSDFLPSVFNETELNSLKTVADLQQKAIDAAKTVDRAKMLMTGAGAAAVGGGIAGKVMKLGMEK
jgi:hypothetical protein